MKMYMKFIRFCVMSAENSGKWRHVPEFPVKIMFDDNKRVNYVYITTFWSIKDVLFILCSSDMCTV